jgi:hypothetical protein
VRRTSAPTASVAMRSKLYAPGVVGMPAMTVVPGTKFVLAALAFRSCSPGGSEPLARRQV